MDKLIYKGNLRDFKTFAEAGITKGSYNERAIKYFQYLGATANDFNTAYKQALAVGGFTPLQLFANGEQGAWYDPSDLTTLYQDAAGTTPVTADGDPVGLMLDKSGSGNHASQSVSAARPIYPGLQYDGVNDFLAPGFLVPGSGDFFISTVVDTDGATGRAVAWSMGAVVGAEARSIILYVNDSSNGDTLRLFVTTNSATGSDIKNTGSRLLTVARTGDDFKVYIDGALDIELTSAGDIIEDNLGIGSIRYAGTYEEVRVGSMISRAGPVSEAERENAEAYLMREF